MKFVKIEHVRCQEYDCVTYGFVPDDWTQERFNEAVDAAQEAHLAALAEVKKLDAEAPPKTFKPDYDSYPDKTVAEVKALFETAKEQRRIWDDAHRHAARSFGSFLKEQGVLPFWEMDPDLEADLDWGHRHGQALDYRDKNPDASDVKFEQPDGHERYVLTRADKVPKEEL